MINKLLEVDILIDLGKGSWSSEVPAANCLCKHLLVFVNKLSDMVKSSHGAVLLILSWHVIRHRIV